MKVLSLASVLLLALGLVDARPAFSLSSKRNATLDQMIAKRQTSRNQINLRAHVKDTVKRVQANAVEARAKTNQPPTRAATAEKRQTSQQRREVFGEEAAPAKRAFHDEEALASRVQSAEKRQTSQGRRSIGLDAAGPAAARSVKRSEEEERSDDFDFEERSVYPRCSQSGARTGYAHYPGWKLIGDNLSGGLPITPESACVQACNKYGGSCSGIHFDAVNKRCFLKGVHTTAWDFEEATSNDSTDLVGGCALWANVVPEDMDAVCCRD